MASSFVTTLKRHYHVGTPDIASTLRDEVLTFLATNPDEDYCYRSQGTLLVIGMRMNEVGDFRSTIRIITTSNYVVHEYEYEV